MINPDKLWSAVVDVYGIDTAKTQYGSLIPIDKDRIDELQEGKVVMLGDRAIEVWDAPGHAKHHVFFSAFLEAQKTEKLAQDAAKGRLARHDPAPVIAFLRILAPGRPCARGQ